MIDHTDTKEIECHLFYKDGLTLTTAWISNHIHNNVWDEITCPLKFENG